MLHARCDVVVVDGVFVLMDGANCGGREGEVAGPGAAELVEEGLNTHLPPPERLIKEERRQHPASQLPLQTRTCTRRCASLLTKAGLSFSSVEVLIEHAAPQKTK